MTCKYCGQEERYGHNAICVMNTVEELRAEIKRLQASLKMTNGGERELSAFLKQEAEVERLRLRVKFLEDELKCAEPKP